MTDDALISGVPYGFKWDILAPDAISDPHDYWPLRPPEPHEIVLLQNSHPSAAWAVQHLQEYADQRRIPRSNIVAFNFGPDKTRWLPQTSDLQAELRELVMQVGYACDRVNARLVLAGYSIPVLWDSFAEALPRAFLDQSGQSGDWVSLGSRFPASVDLPGVLMRLIRDAPGVYRYMRDNPSLSYVAANAFQLASTVVSNYSVVWCIDNLPGAPHSEATARMVPIPGTAPARVHQPTYLSWFDVGPTEMLTLPDLLGCADGLTEAQLRAAAPVYHYETDPSKNGFGSKARVSGGSFTPMYATGLASKSIMRQYAQRARRDVVAFGRLGIAGYDGNPGWETEALTIQCMQQAWDHQKVLLTREQAKLKRKILYSYHYVGHSGGSVMDLGGSSNTRTYAAHAAAAKRWGFTVDEFWQYTVGGAEQERFRPYSERTYDFSVGYPGAPFPTEKIDLYSEGTSGLDYTLLCGYSDNAPVVNNPTFYNSFAPRSGGLVLMGASYPYRLMQRFIPAGGFMGAAHSFHWGGDSTDEHNGQVFWLLAGATVAEAYMLGSMYHGRGNVTIPMGDPGFAPWGDYKLPPMAGFYANRLDAPTREAVSVLHRP